eukprot:gnl/Chilomastix_caulleri/8248.p1 GENE.gnl/Chilomastix_caulleri/8248~~gnl/Chilomastix_caulleri/8248.p1  ORF type:complete len:112 (+),score=14.59 gnl/Chilomastix_caulleri/8248:147-482(+)
MERSQQLGEMGFLEACTNMSELIIPEGVNEIAKDALYETISLDHLDIPKSLWDESGKLNIPASCGVTTLCFIDRDSDECKDIAFAIGPNSMVGDKVGIYTTCSTTRSDSEI